MNLRGRLSRVPDTPDFIEKAFAAFQRDPRSEYQLSLESEIIWATEQESLEHWRDEIDKQWEGWYQATLPVSDCEHQEGTCSD